MSTTKTTDATGALTSVVSPAGTITYTYKPDGQAASIAAPGGATTTFSYDIYGRQTQITDPSAGTVTYTYDAAGNRNSVKDANNKTVNSTFDSFNRLTGKTAPEFNTTYTFNTDGWLAAITNTNGGSKSFTYDNLGRVTQTTETVSSESYQVNYTYTNGRLTKTVHSPMAYTINYLYNAYGYLNKLTDVNNVALKTINKITVFGQVEEVLLGNGLLQTNTFNTYGLLTGIKSMNGTTAVQHMTYTVDNLKGNISSRKDETRNLTENFTYDNLDRLLNYGTSSVTKTITYANATGNIASKSDVGTYKYNTSGKPYAMSSVTVTSGNTVPTALQEVTYTSFARPKQLKEGTYTLDFTYDEGYKRIKQEFKTSGSLTYTRYYFNDGQYEKTVQGSTTKTIFYLDGSPYTATVALENNNGTTRLLYINRDNIGSITHITNASKILQAEYSYDAWGRMRNPANLALYAFGSDPALLLNRGYTGHEHTKEFNLINMNARLYDAIVGRMLSPDNYVQKSDDPMNFNRYTYAMNNPVRYNDPSGDFFLEFIVGFIHGFFSSGHNRFQNGINAGWEKAQNTGLLLQGLVEGNGRQILSRFFKEGIQTGIGFTWSWFNNIASRDVTVEHFDGATVTSSPNFGFEGVTLGSYITGSDVRVRTRGGDFNPTFMHEYGHYLQSQRSGPLYLFKYGLPSALTEHQAPFGLPMPRGTFYDGAHEDFWVEMDANNRAAEYFGDPKRGSVIWNFPDFPIGNVRNPEWWEPLAFTLDPLKLVRYNRPQDRHSPFDFILGLIR